MTILHRDSRRLRRMRCSDAAANAQTNVQADVQAYPSKPITIVVPFGPGSATDTIARIIGQQLSTRSTRRS